MPARFAVSVLFAVLLAGHVSPAWSQIPTEGIDPVDALTEGVNETVEETVNAVNTVGSSATGSVDGSSIGGSASTLPNDAGGAPMGNGSATPGASGETMTGAETHDSSRNTAIPRTGSRPGLRPDRALERRRNEAHASIVSLAGPLIVRKSNDADHEGSFSDEEVAPSPEADVAFRVEILNTGSTELTITAVRDALEGWSGEYEIPVCYALLGERIPAGATVDCSFSFKGYAPQEGRKVNTLRVTAVETTDPSTRVSGTDTSAVTVSEVAVQGITINPLATTGSDVARLLRFGFALLAWGALLVTAGRLREEAASIRVR